MPHPRKSRLSITGAILKQLREDAIERRAGEGVEWCRAHFALVAALDARNRHAPALAGYLAQWIDLGFIDATVVRNLLSRFPKPLQNELPLKDYIQLRIAEGIIAECGGEPASAARHFDFVISLGEDAVADRQLLALAHFRKARAQRSQGEYEIALAHTNRAREIAADLGHTKMVAAIQVLEGWLCLDKEKPQRAMEVLREAEAVLQDTDDFLSLGSIHCAFGQLALHEGRYDLALNHFTRAISLYGKRDSRHPDIARSFTNIAHSQRWTAIRLTRRIDNEVVRRRRSAACSPEIPETRDAACGIVIDLSSRQQIEKLRAEAAGNLDRAEEIYGFLGSSQGKGMVRIERGFLFLDSGDLERAELEANQAWDLGAASEDRALMAGARILQSLIEGAKYDEEIDEDPGRHALRAHDYSNEALAFAGSSEAQRPPIAAPNISETLPQRPRVARPFCASSSEDHRLLARAYICQGLTNCNSFFNNVEAAKDCCQRAGALLPAGCRDHLWDEYQMLAARVLMTGNVDATLRKWTQGLVENKTFQQMVDEFAELVIPSIWEREGKNISRVVAKLSISPKKVRRVLSRAGVKACGTGVSGSENPHSEPRP
jgi:tetratricopeptide (TPR) repeat protein